MKLPILYTAVIIFGLLASSLSLHAMHQQVNPFAQGLVEAVYGKQIHELTNAELANGACCCAMGENCATCSFMIGVLVGVPASLACCCTPEVAVGGIIAAWSCSYYMLPIIRTTLKPFKACKDVFIGEFYRRNSPQPVINKVKPQKNDKTLRRRNSSRR